MQRDYDKEIEELRAKKFVAEIQGGWEKLGNFPFGEYNGQQVLIEHGVLEPINFGVPPGRQRYASVRTRYFGLLAEPYIFRKENRSGIVTSKHVVQSERRLHGRGWTPDEQPIEFDLFYLRNLTVNKKSTREELLINFANAEPFEGVRMFVGDNVVSDYFRSRLDIPAEILDKDPERYRDLSYVGALQLLGLEIPEDFKQVYDGIMREKKLSILAELRNKVFEDIRLKNETDRLEKSIKEGNVFRIDEAREALNKKRRRQLEIEEEIRPQIKAAINLDLHTSEEELELEFGTRVPVGRYVTELSRYYKVDIASE